MKWKPFVRSRVPRNRTFLAIWNDFFCLAEWQPEKDCFWIVYAPVTMPNASCVTREDEDLFSHWANVDELEFPEELCRKPLVL